MAKKSMKGKKVSSKGSSKAVKSAMNKKSSMGNKSMMPKGC